MRDYFALFALPRLPAPDLGKLEEKYRELARASHPDQSTNAALDFAEVNEAYRTLRDPRSRLQHLLALESKPPLAATAEVPSDLANLFMKIASAVKNNDKEEIDSLIDQLRVCYEGAISQLHQLNEAWVKKESSSLIEAEDLCRRFAFLTRWKNLLEEEKFKIATDC